MYEQSKAAKRRFNDGAFHTRYFVGNGLDIGAGPDGLSRYREMFPRIVDIRDWDMPDGDAQVLASVPDGHYDFIHSSHSLEHMVDVRVALNNWIRVVRPGGYLVLLVPDEDMYERGAWPSRHNSDHKWTFTVFKRDTWSPKSVNLIDLVREFGDVVELERLNVVRDFFRPEIPGDQTRLPVTECAIEVVLRRRPPVEGGAVRHSPRTRSLVPPIGKVRLKSCRRGLMLFDADDGGAGHQLDIMGESGEAEIDVFSKLVATGDVVVDVGAGIGVAAIALGRFVGPTGTVHAFEAREHAWRQLVANTALNELDNVRCWHATIGAGTPDAAPEAGPATRHLAIDDLELARCRLIRLMLDGAEPAALESARETIKRCSPLLYLGAARPPSARLAVDVLAQAGYDAFWHLAPVGRAANHFGRPIDAFRGSATVSIFAAPRGFAVAGLPKVRSGDWRADCAAPVEVPA